jgi:ribosomal protein S16
MATTIRLKRVGAKKEASFRIVVMDSREGTAGKSIERLGSYNPRTSPSLIKINAARTIHWLHEGAVPSDSVKSLLRKTGVWVQWNSGVTPEAVEQEVVEIGPPPGERGTSQRTAPVEKKMRASAAEVAAAAAPVVEAEAEAPAAEEATEEAPAEEPAAEAEEAPEAEAEAEEAAPEAEAEEEPAAEAEAEEAAPEAEAEEEPAAEAEEEPVAEAEAEEAAPEAEAEEEPAAEAEEEPVAEAEEAPEAEATDEPEEETAEEGEEEKS